MTEKAYSEQIYPEEQHTQMNQNGSYMSAHELLNVLNKLRKRDKIGGLPRILSLFRNNFPYTIIQEQKY